MKLSRPSNDPNYVTVPVWVADDGDIFSGPIHGDTLKCGIIEVAVGDGVKSYRRYGVPVPIRFHENFDEGTGLRVTIHALQSRLKELEEEA